MATYLEITDGVVTNRVECDAVFAASAGLVGPNETANIGDAYDPETGESTPPSQTQPTIAVRRDILTARINERRDRIIDGGFEHGGHIYQSRPTDRENIKWYYDKAKAYVAAGVALNEPKWNDEDPSTDFAWRTAANAWVKMTAPQAVALGERAAAFKRGATFYGIGLKAGVDASNVTHQQLDDLETQIEADWPV